MKYYITQAGIEFLKEDDDSRRRQQRPIPGRRASELRDTPKGRSISNQSKDYAGHKERMKGHMDRIAAKERLDRKMGRDVNEARGDQYLKGRGVHSGVEQTRTARIQDKPKTRRRTAEIVHRKVGALKDAQKRVSEVPELEQFDQDAEIYHAVKKLRASRKKKQRMEADLEKGWGGTNEARGDHLKKIVIPPLPDEYSSPKYQKKTTTKRYKRRQAEVRAVIKKRGHPDAAKEADLLRMRRNRGVQWRTMHSLTPNQRSVLDVQNRGQVRPDTPW
jgi:hypothetical protein